MKRYIKASNSNSTDYEVDESYRESDGEQRDKYYRGVGIRDFRNGWKGVDDFEILKDDMDKALEAFDEIVDSNPDLTFQRRFFNAYQTEAMALMFRVKGFAGHPDLDLASIDGPWHKETSSSKYISGLGTNWSVSLSGSKMVLSESNPSPDSIASAWNELRDKVLKQENSRAARRTNRLERGKQLFRSLLNEDFSDSELTVPIETEVSDVRSDYNDPSVPDDNYIVDRIENSVPIEDVNRFIDKIVVRLTISGTSVCLYPKFGTTRLRVDWRGKTTSTQFDGACRALSRRISSYLDSLTASYK